MLSVVTIICSKSSVYAVLSLVSAFLNVAGLVVTIRCRIYRFFIIVGIFMDKLQGRILWYLFFIFLLFLKLAKSLSLIGGKFEEYCFIGMGPLYRVERGVYSREFDRTHVC